MFFKIFLGFIWLCFNACILCAHEEHSLENGQKWIDWLGHFHLIFLHFPIALFSMAAVSELLYGFLKKPLFDQAAIFMLASGAFLTIPTALFGLIFSYREEYAGQEEFFFYWHRFMGLACTIFAFLVLYLRYRYQKKLFYYLSLIILFIGINVTAFFGGELSFPDFHLFP